MSQHLVDGWGAVLSAFKDNNDVVFGDVFCLSEHPIHLKKKGSGGRARALADHTVFQRYPVRGRPLWPYLLLFHKERRQDMFSY